MALESPDDGFGNISVAKPALSFCEVLVCKANVPQHQTRAPHNSFLAFSSPWQHCWGWEGVTSSQEWKFKSSSLSDAERNDAMLWIYSEVKNVCLGLLWKGRNEGVA